MKKKDTKNGAKTPKARVMFGCSKDMPYLDTLVLQPKSYGPALDVPLVVVPHPTKCAANRAAHWHNLSREEKMEAILDILYKKYDYTWSRADAVLRLME